MTEKLSSDEERARAITGNIESVRRQIAEAARKAGRDLSEITLVAVTKTMPAQDINTALSCGIDVFGENRVQELLQKQPMIDMQGKHAHLIGHLQTNKIKQIIDKVEMIQSLDSLKLAKEIDTQAQKADITMDVLIEVNIGREVSKSGIDPDMLPDFLENLHPFRHINVCGLMAIPPFNENKELSRPYFAQMYKLFIDFSKKKSDNINMHILSMGMSSDFDIAIEEGSTMVRIGTAIFGKR